MIGKVGSGDGFISNGNGSEPRYIQIKIGEKGWQTLSTTTKPEEAASIEKIKAFMNAYGMRDPIDSKMLTILRTMEAEPRIVASLNSQEIKSPRILKIITVFNTVIKFLMRGISEGEILEIQEKAFDQQFKTGFKEYNRLEAEFSRAVENIALPGIFTKTKARFSQSAAQNLEETQREIHKALNLVTPKKSDSSEVRVAKIHLEHTHKDTIEKIRKHFKPSVGFHKESEVREASGESRIVKTDFTPTAFVTLNLEKGLSGDEKSIKEEEKGQMRTAMYEKDPEMHEGKRALDDVDSLRSQIGLLPSSDDLVKVAKDHIQSLITTGKKLTDPQLFLLNLVEELVLDNIEDFIDQDTKLIDYEKCKQVVKETIITRNEKTREIARGNSTEIATEFFTSTAAKAHADKDLAAAEKIEADLPNINRLVDVIFDNKETQRMLQEIRRENETYTW